MKQCGPETAFTEGLGRDMKMVSIAIKPNCSGNNSLASNTPITNSTARFSSDSIKLQVRA